ncbi:MAG: hypothetical protein IR526_00270 [Bordetella sp.]|nr:MAG: hypothetical protein IR526_00270 [Bordetella sp.]
MFCDVNGNLPNHDPYLSNPENLIHLIKFLLKNDFEIGLAFDSDGDRLNVITKSGRIIFSDQFIIIFSKEILKSYPGSSIVYNVKCSSKLDLQIQLHLLNFDLKQVI